MINWHPINTAPKGGVRVKLLLWTGQETDGFHQADEELGQWYVGLSSPNDSRRFYVPDWAAPTHWQPIEVKEE